MILLNRYLSIYNNNRLWKIDTPMNTDTILDYDNIYDFETSDCFKDEYIIEYTSCLKHNLFDNLIKLGLYSSYSSINRAIKNNVLSLTTNIDVVDINNINFDYQYKLYNNIDKAHIDVFNKYCCCSRYIYDYRNNYIKRNEIYGVYNDDCESNIFEIELSDFNSDQLSNYKFGDIVEFKNIIYGVKYGWVVNKASHFSNQYDIIIKTKSYDIILIHSDYISKVIKNDEEETRTILIDSGYIKLFTKEFLESIGIN